MGNLSLETSIAAPCEAVFRLITDLEQAPSLIAGIDSIELLTEGPMQVGTRWRETRTLMGQTSTEEFEVTAFEPGASYSAACESCGCLYESSFTCRPSSSGTDLVLDLSWKPLTLMAKVMSPIGALMAGSMKKALLQDLADIKQTAEQAA